MLGSRLITHQRTYYTWAKLGLPCPTLGFSEIGGHPDNV
jgi:hypothetical protein